MLTREEIARQLAELDEALIPERLTRREVEALLRERLSAGLHIDQADVTIEWRGGKLHVRIPTRLHYVEHFDFILARIDAVAQRAVWDLEAQTPGEFTDLMKRLRKP